MNFHTRKWVKPEDLNPNGSLFGGRLLQWIDEEAVIYAIVQLENPRVVTKFISEINFINAPKQGDIIEIGILATSFGRTSITMRCEVRNKMSREPILNISKLVFVNVDERGLPVPHGKTQISYVKERLQIKEIDIKTSDVTTSLPPTSRPREGEPRMRPPYPLRIEGTKLITLHSRQKPVYGQRPTVNRSSAHVF